jgi:predicted Holliday junction resolvase-like endonuclease
MEFIELLAYFFVLFVCCVVSFLFGKFFTNISWEKQLKNIRQDAIKKSRSVLSGQFSEQIAPYLPGFDFSPSEVRFIGKPIDFIVFKGMDEKQIYEVIFIEVKSSNSKLNLQEKNLREAIEQKRVRWVEYKVPKM